MVICQNYGQLANEKPQCIFCVYLWGKWDCCVCMAAVVSLCAHILAPPACPDPVSHGLIGLFECEAAFRLALAVSAAICLYNVAAFHCWRWHTHTHTRSFSRAVMNADVLLEIIAGFLHHILQTTGLLRMVACFLTVCVAPALSCLSFFWGFKPNITHEEIPHWKWTSGYRYITALI